MEFPGCEAEISGKRQEDPKLFLSRSLNCQKPAGNENLGCAEAQSAEKETKFSCTEMESAKDGRKEPKFLPIQTLNGQKRVEKEQNCLP